jgi:LRR receptor-like serine/threonine-protein kinase ERECTA
MEAVDCEVSVTCTDMNHVKKMFQLALLCTKRHPYDRPTMHEVSRVLISLLPLPVCSKKSVFTAEPKTMDFTRFLMPSPVARHERDTIGSSSSDAQWFVRFGEAISKNSM